MLAEALEQRGQVQAIDGQAVHNVFLDNQPAERLQGRNWKRTEKVAEPGKSAVRPSTEGWRSWRSFSEALWLKAVVDEFVLWHRPALGSNWLCGGWCQAALAGLEAQGPRAAKLFPLLGGRLGDSYVPKLCVTVPGLHFFLWWLSSNSRVSHTHAVLPFHPTPLVCLLWPQHQAAGWVPAGWGCSACRDNACCAFGADHRENCSLGRLHRICLVPAPVTQTP